MNVSVRWRRRGWLALGFALLWVVNQFLPLIPNPYFGTRVKWQETLTLSSGEQIRVGRKARPGGQEVWQHTQAIVERTENNGFDAKSVLSDRSLPWRELAKFKE